MLTRSILWAEEAYTLLFNFVTLDTVKTSACKIPVNLAKTHQHKFKIINMGTKTHFSTNCKNLPEKLGTQQGQYTVPWLLCNSGKVAHGFQHKLQPQIFIY